MDRALWNRLACPRDFGRLSEHGSRLACPNGHIYPIIDGVPILTAVPSADLRDPCPVRPPIGGVDGWVQEWIVTTGGNMYRDLVGRLVRYPVPEFPLAGQGEVLIDVGCGWGRWSLAAVRSGFQVIGIDRNFEAIQAARRVAHQLGLAATFVVGDARNLPIASQSMDAAFSYSVLQHLSRPHAARSIASIGRVLKPDGRFLIQMAAQHGPRAILEHTARRFRSGGGNGVRYWALPALRACVETHIGLAQIDADGFFSLNPRVEDRELLRRGARAVVTVSRALTAATRYVPALTAFADSVWISARRR